ncbi:MAG TPA: HEAT repeat domain-containing protein [Pirellulales bacterium]
MYDEDSTAARWARWIGRTALAMAVTGAIAWWFYLNRPRQGPWSNTPRQNLAVLRDRTRRESERRVAGDALEHADGSIAAELIAELEQGDPLGRELAAISLGRLGGKASGAIEPLTVALNDAVPAVRMQAALALGRVCSHPQTVVAAMRQVVHDADSHVRETALKTLARQEVAGAQALADLLTDADADVRRRVAIELGRMGSEADGAAETLRAARNDADPLVRAEALAALCRRRAIVDEELVAAINDPDKTVRSTAFTLLGKMGPRAESAVPELIRCLEAAGDAHDDETIGNIAITLGKIGPAARPATAALLALLNERQAYTWVFHGLHSIGLEAEFEPPELFQRVAAAGGAVKSLIVRKDSRERLRAASPPQESPNTYVVTDEDLIHLRELHNLEFLDVSDWPITDAGVAHLAGLTHLKSLQLWQTKTTSAGLVHLANLTELRWLSLRGCAITDEGLRHLRQLDQLESLGLHSTQVTDAGMRELAGLTRLKHLGIGGTSVTDEGLAQLKHLPIEELGFSKGQFTLAALSGFPQLKELRLVDEPITDDDLAALPHLTELRTLSIRGAPITDAGLAHLSGLKELESLVLSETRVTDAGLKHLSGLTKLRSLFIDKCDVTEQGADALAERLPALQVTLPHRRAAQPVAPYQVVGLEDLKP